MKRMLMIAFVAISFTACDVYVTEPRYDARDRIVGRFYVDEYSETFNNYTSYTIHISKSAYYSDEVSIDNLYASGLNVTAYVSYSKITIPYQVINGYEIEGTGTIYDYDISLNYSVRDLHHAVPTDFCSVDARMIY